MGILILNLTALLVLSFVCFFLGKAKYINLLKAVSQLVVPLIMFSLFIPIYAALFDSDNIIWNSAWSFFQYNLNFRLDALSAFFLLPITIISITACIFGPTYLEQHLPTKQMGKVWSATFLLIASLITITIANDFILFLIAWELMSFSSFFLVIYQTQNEESRKAGWLYLSLTQIGTFFIIILFFILTRETNSTYFTYSEGLTITPNLSTICFFLALIGFGTKAGLMPLHIWLPEAHPKAPAHISAIMSAVMIKTGIYGILRTTTLLALPQSSWALSLMILGAITSIFSVAFAIAQKDIKRLLAYCSVKNIGIIFMAIGLGFFGLISNNFLITFMGLASALLHILNHALFKGLLFFDAGTIIKSMHTQNMEEMGGVRKIIPTTSFTFLVGSLAICGLPPLNGFISEFLLYLGSFQALDRNQSWNNLPYIFIILILALVGGLAALCFTKAYGTIFLGENRKNKNQNVKLNLWPMHLSSIILCLLSITIGLFPFWAIQLTYEPIKILTQNKINIIFPENILIIFRTLSWIFIIFITLCTILFFIRKLLIKKRNYQLTETWGCGYTHPTPKIQYTGSSFVQMFTDHFNFLLKGKKSHVQINDLFPKDQSFSSQYQDSIAEKIFKPLYRLFINSLKKITHLQHGVLNVYVLYILITLILLLIFKLD